MEKDEFWSVDRLLPKIRSKKSHDLSEKGAEIAGLFAAPLPFRAGEKIFCKNSRIIRSYQFIYFQNPAEAPLEAPFVSVLESAVRNREKRVVGFAEIISYCAAMINRENSEQAALEDFLWLWETYRGDFALADKFFCDLVCDFCLYYGLDFPFERLSPLLCTSQLAVKPFLFNLFLFDYLFTPSHRLNRQEIEFILKNVTKTGYRATKAYHSNARFAGLCEEIVFQCFSKGLMQRTDLNENLFHIQIPSEVKTTRKLFPQIPIGKEGEVRVTLIFIPMLYDENIRERCDALLRYIENRIREMLKLKNSLTRIPISPLHKSFIESILAPYEVQTASFRKQAEISTEKPDFVPRKIEVDIAKAIDIEEESWGVTKELTESFLSGETELVAIGAAQDEEFDRKYAAELEKIEKPQSEAGEIDLFWEFAAALTPEEERLLDLLLYHTSEEARAYAFSIGQFFEGMLAAINAKAQDTVEDVICSAGGKLFEEYIPILKTVFLPKEGDAHGTGKN